MMMKESRSGDDSGLRARAKKSSTTHACRPNTSCALVGRGEKSTCRCRATNSVMDGRQARLHSTIEQTQKGRPVRNSNMNVSMKAQDEVSLEASANLERWMTITASTIPATVGLTMKALPKTLPFRATSYIAETPRTSDCVAEFGDALRRAFAATPARG
mmetsp:Transcript_91040/g.190409  ORF Transcript_91040/g.190409 Transcript_91040/m.190409 type:complete len:159 (-) Transcript_91040:1415-1891(-)